MIGTYRDEEGQAVPRWRTLGSPAMGSPHRDLVLGDSAFPVSAGSGGQWGANNSTADVYAACVKLREAVAQKLGFNSADAVFGNGRVHAGNRSVSLAEAAG